MIRMPVTLADLQGARYKSSLAKLKKYSTSWPGTQKLTALREAFAKALGYGTEAELRFVAKKLGGSYTGATLPVTDVIDSVSQRIARQWNVTAELADTVASSLGLQHFDACRTTPRANSRNTDGDGTSKPVTQVSTVEPFNSHSSADSRTVIHSVPQSLSSNSLEADFDRLQFERDRFKAERDRLVSSNWEKAQSAIDEFMKANPAQSAIDQLMKANPAQSAIDKVMSLNPAMAKLESIFANPAITALDRLYANPQIAALLARKGDDAETEA